MVKSFLVGIAVAVIAWPLSASQAPVSVGEAWDRFCSWAVGAEPWAAAIALAIPGAALVWLATMYVGRSEVAASSNLFVHPPFLSFLGVASVAAISAYFGVSLAAQSGSPITIAAFDVCAAMLSQLVRMVRAAGLVYF